MKTTCTRKRTSSIRAKLKKVLKQKKLEYIKKNKHSVINHHKTKNDEFMESQIKKILEYLETNPHPDLNENEIVTNWISENSEEYRKMWTTEHGDIDVNKS